MAEKPRSVSLEDVTAAAMSGVLRALEARRPEVDRGDLEAEVEFPKFLGPILIGIIMNPPKDPIDFDVPVQKPGG